MKLKLFSHHSLVFESTITQHQLDLVAEQIRLWAEIAFRPWVVLEQENISRIVRCLP